MNKHLKKGYSTLIFIFSLCLASSALAGGYIAPAPVAKAYFDGFYAGLGGGVVSSTANVKNYYDHISIGAGNGRSWKQKLDLGKHGINGNVFAGFGKTLNSTYYLGGELFGNLFSPEMKGSYSGGPYLNMDTEVKSPYSFGGDIRGGYLVFPKVMLYILFGLDYAKFKIKSSMLYISDYMRDSFSKWKLGYMPGLGVEIGLCNYLSLRAQYTYTFYPSFSHSKTKTFRADEYGILKTKVDPSRGLFTLKLSYLF
jgi:opacity protein-like surface antigen